MADELQLSQDLVFREYADWCANSRSIYKAKGIRLSLSNEVWEALANHAHRELQILCENVACLPRELRDSIYDTLLEDMDEAICPSVPAGSESSWWDSLPHLSASHLGQVFLHEFMYLYYSRTSFKLNYKIPGRWTPGDTPLRRPGRGGYDRSRPPLPSAEKPPGLAPFDMPLWALLSKDSFGSTHVPATLINKIEISIPYDYTTWEDPSPIDLLEAPEDATRIQDSKVCIIITAVHYIYLRAKSCYRGPRREASIHVKDFLRRLEPALTRLTELGIDVQLEYASNCGRKLYPSSSVLTELREEQAALAHLECRESSRPGLRKLRGVRKRYPQ
ncbi:hypothetical protein IQ06DRAFT_115845 [Phaeosphaeriaceae sp. SRC1lsM3a]|nr:hypothetical protein IQ06DRAFT_115845 [Stagonospora sp. SRC1lsM3a]